MSSYRKIIPKLKGILSCTVKPRTVKTSCKLKHAPERHIQSEVETGCCTEPNCNHGPWRPLHPLSVFLLHFLFFFLKELHCAFFLGPQARFVWREVRHSFEHNLNITKHPGTCTSTVPGEWTLKDENVVFTILTITLLSSWRKHQYTGNQVKNKRK